MRHRREGEADVHPVLASYTRVGTEVASDSVSVSPTSRRRRIQMQGVEALSANISANSITDEG
ncbi:hypothetical protein B8W95_13165 [Staphylococcus pasteuri]|jgi:hypothetical protein|nr:hypothetical protein B8W95_13165 [Staphylococcus pasteuri]